MQLSGVTVEVRKLEAAPLVAYWCRELRVAEIMDAHVTWDRHRTEVSPGTTITALLVNLLVRREPLYRIEWFFPDMDVKALFGNGIEAGHFNDDRLAPARRERDAGIKAQSINCIFVCFGVQWRCEGEGLGLCRVSQNQEKSSIF